MHLDLPDLSGGAYLLAGSASDTGRARLQGASAELVGVDPETPIGRTPTED